MNIEFQNRWSKPGFNLIEINLMKIGNDRMGYRWTLFFYILNVGFIYKSKVENEIFKKIRKDFRDDRDLLDYWKLMNRDQIEQVSTSKFVAIGSHGYYHNNLGVLPVNIALNEVETSKKYLEDIIQKPLISIAYPDGSYNNKLLEETKRLGIHIQFLYGAKDNEFKKISGVYDREGLYSKASSENEIFYKLINGKTNRTIL
jgi:peptidoglycan/xylan/chitin deacetylase (PgdA/CDA1 family)